SLSHSLTSMMNVIGELEQLRSDRAARRRLWNDEIEVPLSGTSLLSGDFDGTITLARKVAKTTITVLITGESGTGKEIVARTIHAASDRAQKAFVPFNCTAVPRDLIESHLFGHRRGAFTGADRDQPGLIRAARDGTLFLDEIGELSLDLQ